MTNADGLIPLRPCIKDITSMGIEIWSYNEENGWHENWNLPEKLMMVVTELAEAMEELRDHDSNHVYKNKDNPDKLEGFPVEVADAMIRLWDIAVNEGFGYTLVQLLNAKNEYNKTRGYRHGGRKY